MRMFFTVLQITGVVLVVLYFATDSLSSMIVLVPGIILAVAGHIGRSMSGARLHMAARRGDVLEMQHWLAKGFKINSKRENGFTPLHWVAFKGILRPPSSWSVMEPMSTVVTQWDDSAQTCTRSGQHRCRSVS